jgi:cobalt-zinc-cadmium efflux system protein
MAGSLALLSDSGRCLHAEHRGISPGRPACGPARQSARLTFAKRAEILSAAANGITLFVVSGIIALEAIRRLIHPPPVDGGPVLVVALIGVGVNILAAWSLTKANRSSLNIEGAFKHILTDLYGFIGTVIAGIVIITTGFVRADSIASLVVVALMLRAAWGLLRDSGRVLLEAAPEGVDLDDIRAHLLEDEHVKDVHDLHVWTLTSDLPTLSAHVVMLIRAQRQPCTPTARHLAGVLDRALDVEHPPPASPASHAAHEPERTLMAQPSRRSVAHVGRKVRSDVLHTGTVKVVLNESGWCSPAGGWQSAMPSPASSASS